MKWLARFLVLTCATAPAVHAWHDEGHYYSAMAAVEALPDDVPAFFRDGAAVVAHGSIDPDVAKHRAAPQLRETEEPEHYLDLELLQGRPLPQTRNEYRALCAEMNSAWTRKTRACCLMRSSNGHSA